MKLSIITICYNSEATIEKTVKSVISQKTKDVEYLIIDGMSKDGTMDIINRYKDDIDVIVSEKDKGISDAFNKGIENASGEYIGIINSDDQFLPGAFERFFKEIKNDTDVFFGNGIRLYDNGRCKKYMADSNIQELHKGMSLVHPSTIVKKAAYEKYGKFDVNYKFVMDRECLLRMLNGGAKFQYSEGFYTIYNMGGTSDKNYIKGVIPESYKIDLADGMSKVKAMKNYGQRYLMFYLVKLRDKVKKNDSRKISFAEMMKQINS